MTEIKNNQKYDIEERTAKFGEDTRGQDLDSVFRRNDRGKASPFPLPRHPCVGRDPGLYSEFRTPSLHLNFHSE